MTKLAHLLTNAIALLVWLAIALSFHSRATGQQPGPLPLVPQARPDTAAIAQEKEADDGADAEGEEQTAEEKERALIAKLGQELDEIERRIDGTDGQAKTNSQILKSVKKELQQEYLANHAQLVTARTTRIAVEDDEALSKVLRRQKVIAMYLVELESRDEFGTGFDADAYRELAKFQKHPDVRRNVELQRRAGKLMQRMTQRRSRQRRKKSVHEITAPLVGVDHLAPQASRTLPEYPAADDGLLQQYRGHIKRLVRIKWDGPHLTVDQKHWDTPFAGKSEVDVMEEVDSLLAQRGFRGLKSERKLVRNQQRVVMFRGEYVGSNLSRIFRAMQEPDKVRHAALSGQTGNERLLLRTPTLESRLNRTNKSFLFDFNEENERGAILRIREDARGLSIQSLGEVSLQLKQYPDGSIKVVELADDQTYQFSADSFAEFYRENMEYCESRFLPFLDHLGLTGPQHRMDRAVVRCAIDEIRLLSDQNPDTAEVLIKQLSSDKYAEREEATKRLEQSIGHYAPQLRKALEGSLHVEAKMRIRALLHEAKRSQTQQIVAELGLMTDVDYLKRIIEECSDADRSVVETRIAQLIGRR